ncbi:CU044_2847 family protein [Streptomyces sp. NRRL B-24484]|uniref:CU044_2847 family protein n=1 Tax=Streptomyces sp. NRRL B-24484 TaxID=1463833 RepID=UPI0007C4BA6F|nr:CU044_2847 family protein [Streptomyces sp. NRRL B-24484]
MTGFTEVALSDGTSVLLQVFDLESASPSPSPSPSPSSLSGTGGPGGSGGGGGADLPDGAGEVVAVGRLRDASRTTGEALREALQPLGSVLDLVHGAVRSAARPPEQVEVEFGVKLSKDLRLGIVAAGGEAALTVRATWRVRPDRAVPPPASPVEVAVSTAS